MDMRKEPLLSSYPFYIVRFSRYGFGMEMHR